ETLIMATFVEIGPHWLNVDAIAGLYISEGGKRVQLYFVGNGTGAPALFTGEDALVLIEALRPLLAARCIAGDERIVEDASAHRGVRVELVPGRVERLTE